ncbi:MAG: hypothetical protein CMJ81_11520 [Planctomycetaceae bacterium]|jgi:drug/metabolite transporter (DMT)-like permease|nr:hypothetical protein [Planctomycetaceae bacterium]MBP60804.1 hypothetical protein [Planctomycetaceae bacterium]
MQFFVLYVICNLIFVQWMRFSQFRGADTSTVAAINFLVAAAASAVAVFFTSTPSSMLDPVAISLGIVNGLLYCTHLLSTLAAFRFVGTGITMALTHIACIFPVVFSHVVWPEKESMSLYRWLAVGLVPLAVYCLRPTRIGNKPLTWKTELLLLFVFLGVGVIFIVHKIAAATTTAEVALAYQMYIFGVAGVSTTIIVAIIRPFPSRLDLRFGISAGLVNALMCRAIVLALAMLGAVFVYLCGPPLLIVFNVLCGRVLWGEELSKRQFAGLFLAIAIILLTNSDRLLYNT